MMTGMSTTRDLPDADWTWPLSIPEAAAIIGCGRNTLNVKILEGRVPATRRVDGKWMLDPEGLAIAEALIHPKPRPVKSCKTCHQVGELLFGWGTGTVAEMTLVMGIHEGNVRKHLNHLGGKGLAIRRVDGAWELTEPGTEWMTEAMKWLRPTPPDDFYDESNGEVSPGT